MKTMNVKKTHEELVQEFLAKGGVIKKCQPQTQTTKTRKVEVVEIEVDALPKELIKKYFGE